MPWFAIGSASANGEVQVVLRDGRIVYVPPIPVLAPAQTDPALAPQHSKVLWDAVDDMRTRWIRSAPIKAFGLDRWWGAFLNILRQLQVTTGGKFRWVPFDAPATLGKDIRAHDEQYLVTWLEINAERYTATVRAFEDIAQAPWHRAATRSIQKSGASSSECGAMPPRRRQPGRRAARLVHRPTIPSTTYTRRAREEWDWFSKWIGAVTGQKLTDERKKDIKAEGRVRRKPTGRRSSRKPSDARQLLRNRQRAAYRRRRRAHVTALNPEAHDRRSCSKWACRIRRRC